MADDGSADMAKLAADLGRAGAQVGARAGLVMSKALNDIAAGAKNRAPVDTGALRNSISTSTTRSASTVRGEVGPTVHYGHFVELGTVNNRAQPYLRPATDAVLPGYEQALTQLGAEILEE